MSTENELMSSVETTEANPNGFTSVVQKGIIRSRESTFLSATEFAGYEKTLPGAAERLLAIMEKQVEHRIEVENHLIDKDEKFQNVALAIGFIITCIFVIASIIFACLGNEMAAAAAIGCPALYGLTHLFTSFGKHNKT
jgi:uncharacterized membrane protein